MIDYKIELKKQLEKILPTYYETFINSSMKTPCITYLELNNSANAEGDTIRYSNLDFRISIWGEDLKELSNYSSLLDNLMFSLGFKREGYKEMWEGTLGRLIFTYGALGIEK